MDVDALALRHMEGPHVLDTVASETSLEPLLGRDVISLTSRPQAHREGHRSSRPEELSACAAATKQMD